MSLLVLFLYYGFTCTLFFKVSDVLFLCREFTSSLSICSRFSCFLSTQCVYWFPFYTADLLVLFLYSVFACFLSMQRVYWFPCYTIMFCTQHWLTAPVGKKTKRDIAKCHYRNKQTLPHNIQGCALLHNINFKCTFH